MKKVMAAGFVLALVALVGSVGAAWLAAGCSQGGCMMGPNCTMGKMGDSSHCSPKGTDPAQAAPTTPVVGDGAGKSGSAIVNARCPIMGGKPTAALTRDYNGQKVGFCCAGCPAKWDKLTDAEKDAKLATAMAAGK